MAKISLQDRLIKGIKELGAVEIDHSTTRYRAFVRKGWGTFFVGKAGALRMSSNGRVSDSRPVPPNLRKIILSNERTGNEKK